MRAQWLVVIAACAPAAPQSPPLVAHETPQPQLPPRRPVPPPLPPAPPVGECVDEVAAPTLYIRAGFHPAVSRAVVTGPLLGSLEPDAVYRTVMARRTIYAACHQAHPARGLTLSFDIRFDGSPHALTTIGDDAALDRCVCSAVAQLVFAPPGGNTELHVNYPFNFQDP